MNITNRICTINDAVGDDETNALASIMLAVGEPTTFILTALPSNGGLPSFQANYHGRSPPDFWRAPINLVSRGNATATLAPGSEPPLLPPWLPAPQGTGGDPPLRGKYLSALKNLQSWVDIHPSFYRLEGDVLINGVAESVTFYFFAANMVNDGDFVLIEVRADDQEVQTRESGIGHGNF